MAALLAASLMGAPAAAQQAAPEGVPTLSGYMELHLNKEPHLPATVDLHRFVLMVGHRFTDRLKFWSELEIEHGLIEGSEEGGEVAIEQAYVDVVLSRRVNLRAGMVLMPVGIVNERHEPPTFHGVERPFVDTVIVPTTWRDAGAGLYGELGGGVGYRAYVVPGLDATEFSAEEGIAGGRQQGARAEASRPAVTGRVEWRRAGLTLGGSAWRGGSGFRLARLDIEPPSVTIASADARYRRGRHELRGQWATVRIAGAGELNRVLEARRGVNPNIARELLGVYAEAATRLSPEAWPHELVVFGRYERFETQRRMPDGYLPLEQFNRSAWVVGATYFPDPDVAFKVDVVRQRSRSSLVGGAWAVNAGVGWWF